MCWEEKSNLLSCRPSLVDFICISHYVLEAHLRSVSAAKTTFTIYKEEDLSFIIYESIAKRMCVVWGGGDNKINGVWGRILLSRRVDNELLYRLWQNEYRTTTPSFNECFCFWFNPPRSNRANSRLPPN